LLDYMSWYDPSPATDPCDLATVGERVRHLRRHAGMRQADLAERCGLSRTSIANIEAGRQTVTGPVARVMAGEFGVTLDALYGQRPGSP
jgi:transcriptional regulator with XRE-family HTH domain